MKNHHEKQIAPKHSDSTRIERLLEGSSLHRELNEKRQKEQERVQLEQERVAKKKAKASRYKPSKSRQKYLEKKGITLEQYHSNNNRRKDKKR